MFLVKNQVWIFVLVMLVLSSCSFGTTYKSKKSNLIDLQRNLCSEHREVNSCVDDGSGTIESPYLISTIDCLQKIGLAPKCNFKLAANIDASPTHSWNSGLGWKPIKNFEGSLDGGGFRISNLKSTSSVGGLVENIVGSVAVSNIVFENIEITSTSGTAGILVGEISSNSTITAHNIEVLNSSVNSFTDGGGLAGMIVDAESDIEVSDVNMNGLTLISNRHSGGLVGSITNIEVSISLNNITVSGADITGSTNTGGLVGLIESGLGQVSLENIQISNMELTPGSDYTAFLAGQIKDGPQLNLENISVTESNIAQGGIERAGLAGNLTNSGDILLRDIHMENVIISTVEEYQDEPDAAALFARAAGTFVITVYYDTLDLINTIDSYFEEDLDLYISSGDTDIVVL